MLYYWMQKQERPRGVTIIAILIVIAGVLTLFVGIGLLAIGPFIGIGLAFAVFGAISSAIGIAYLVMAYGLLKGKGWAWTISIIVLIIGIVMGIISLPRAIAGVFSNTGSSLSGDIISIGISAFIVYYLYRPHVKAYFGKTTF
jgi:drug/metabolite transporter (DMT)-like permease